MAEIYSSHQRLHGYLNPVPVRIEHYAFIVTIAGGAGLADDFIAIVAKAVCECIYSLFAADGHGEVRKACGLAVGVVLALRNGGHLHELKAAAAFEGEEAGGEVLCGVVIFAAGGGVEVFNVEVFQFFQVVGPGGEVFDFHGIK